MTRITDLTSLNPSSDSIFPVVKETDGVTTKMSVSQYRQLIDAPAGDGDAPGGFLQKTSLYGVPSKISIDENPAKAGNSPTVAVGDIFIATHKSINVPRATSDESHGYNPKDYIAKGLHLKVTAMNGSEITGLDIVNPGQMYKVGDTVQIQGAQPAYSPSASSALVLTGGTIRIDTVEPFIVGPIGTGGNDKNLGGATNKHIFSENSVATPGWDYSTAGDPLGPVTSNVPPRMHLDPSAPLFYDYHSSSHSSANGYSENEYRNAGAGSVWGSSAHSYSASGYHASSVSVAVPGIWFVVGATRSLTSGGSASWSYFLLDETVKDAGNNFSTPLLINDAFPSMGSVQDLTSTVGEVGGLSPIMRVPYYLSHSYIRDTTEVHDSPYALYANYNTNVAGCWGYGAKPLSCTKGQADGMLTSPATGGEWDAHWTSAPAQGRAANSGMNSNNTIYFLEYQNVQHNSSWPAIYHTMATSFFLVPATDILPVSPVL